MTHKKKKMMRKHKKLSPEGKKITAGAASVLLGTGLMMSGHVRPVKAMSSREDEISEVEDANVLSIEKAKVSTRVVQKTTNEKVTEDVKASDINGQSTDDTKSVDEVDTSDDTSTKGTDTETKQPTYDDAVEEVKDINDANDQKLQEAIKDATDQGLNVEVSDKKEEFTTTVGDIKNNKDKLDEYTKNEIEKLKVELEKYKDDQAKYDQAADKYIDKLIKLGLLKEEDRDKAKKGELGQQLILGREHDAVVEVEISKNEQINLKYDTHYSKEYHIDGNITGDFLKLTYTNLSKSTYKGEKIGKIEITYSDLIGGKDHLVVYTDYYTGEFHVHAKSITVTMELYDSKGNKIVLDENTAFIRNYGYGDNTEIIDDGNNKGVIGKNNLFNVSGDKIKIEFTGYRNFIESWLSTYYFDDDLKFNAQKPSIVITPGQLVLNEQAHVNIHYVDVNGVGGSKFSPDQGIELNDQLQSINHLAVGDSYANDLWNWKDVGYILATDSIGLTDIQSKTGDIYIYLKHDTENIVQTQEVQFVVQHKYANGVSMSQDQTFTLVFNRPGVRDKVNGDILNSSSDWTLTNPEILNTLDISVLSNLFGTDKINPETSAISDEALDKLISSGAFKAVVIHEMDQDQGIIDSTPGQATNNPTSGPTLNLVQDPVESEDQTPLPEEEPGPEYSDQPEFVDEDSTVESEKENPRVTSHANVVSDQQVTPENISANSGSIIEESQTTKDTQKNEETLPETGEEHDEFAKVMSGLAAALGITGLAATSKKRKKNNK